VHKEKKAVKKGCLKLGLRKGKRPSKLNGKKKSDQNSKGFTDHNTKKTCNSGKRPTSSVPRKIQTSGRTTPRP